MTTAPQGTPQTPQGGTRPMLALAAESIAAGSGGPAGTVVDVVHGRALRPYREGLRQYLAIRLGNAGTAHRQALAEVRAIVAAKGAEHLVAAPGIRARLYQHARHIAQQRLARDGDPGAAARAALPWRPPRSGSPKHQARIHALRTELDEQAAELLELRHARELGPEEIAFVLDRPVEDVLESLQAATRQALTLLHRDPDGEAPPVLRRALLEAFALETEHSASAVAEGNGGWEALAAGTIVGGRYAIEARVGTGAFGDVYCAKDTEVPGHVVALKLLHQPARSEAARRTALRELHLIASVFHPSIVQFKDHGWHEDRLWFVMPWYEGETLESRMARQPLTRAEARRIFEPLARALATMHAAGIRHQDVKPDNIFLARIQGFGRDEGDDEILPVLIDLGVAAKEAEMVVAGTPTYFAPEVAGQFASTQGHPHVTPKADVFALALSLRNALEPETEQDVPAGAVETFIEERAHETPPMPASRDLRFLQPSFERWMSLDPEERPTADELADELAVLTRPEERKRRRRRVLRWAVPMTLALATVFGAVVYVLNARAERQELEARRARMAEADVRQDLQASRQQRKTLERSVEQARRNYAESRMTRMQLADELARTDDRLQSTRQQLSKTKQRYEQTQSELEGTQDELNTAQSKLASAKSRANRLQDDVQGLRTELAAAKDRAQKAENRVVRLDGRVEALRTRIEAEKAKSDRLEREVEDSLAARKTAEAELARAQQRIAELEAKLAKMRKMRDGSTPSARGSDRPVATEDSDPKPESKASTESSRKGESSGSADESRDDDAESGSGPAAADRPQG